MGEPGIFYAKGRAWKGASSVTEALKAFFFSKGSADRDLAADRQTLAYRSRALFQNSSFAGALINSFDTNVVGTGIKARPAIDYALLGLDREYAEKWQRSVQKLFAAWADTKFCDAERKNDFYQLQDLALKTQLVTGDCFALMQVKYSAQNPFGLQVKLMEGDRCQNPRFERETDRLSAGVETDSFGAPVAYYFTKTPPYSIDDNSSFRDTVRVPAFDMFGYLNVVHAFTSDRTDQRRGIPLLAPIISQIKQQERYQDAELMAAVVSSMFTVFIKNSEGEAEEFYGNVEDPQRVEPIAPNSAAELTPGGIVELGQGEEVSQIANPTRPNANYQPFVEAIFSEAAARVGLSHEVVLRKFNSSYNAVRAAILESRKTFNRVKYDFAADFCQPIYDKWLTNAILTGIVEAPPGYFENPVFRGLYHSCRWEGDTNFMLDPYKETMALKMQLDEQLISRDDACNSLNASEYDSVAINIAEEMKLRRSLGLPEPGAVTRSENTSVQELVDEDKSVETGNEKEK